MGKTEAKEELGVKLPSFLLKKENEHRRNSMGRNDTEGNGKKRYEKEERLRRFWKRITRDARAPRQSTGGA